MGNVVDPYRVMSFFVRGSCFMASTRVFSRSSRLWMRGFPAVPKTRMMMMISPFGQLGLWAVGLCKGCEMYSHRPCVFLHTSVVLRCHGE